MPEVRKEIFLVTKDHPNTPSAADHPARPAAGGARDRLRRPASSSTGSAAATATPRWMAQEPGVQGDDRGDQEVGQGQVRRLLVPRPQTAPSTSRRRPTAGSSTRSWSSTPPGSTRTPAMNRALDACHKQGIGLISMKQVAGQIATGHPRRGPQAGPEPEGEGADRLPGPAPRDLDRRADRLVLRLDAEHRPDPREQPGGRDVRAAEAGRDRTAPRRLPGRRPDLLRRLRRPLRAGPAGTTAALGDLTRLLTYHDQYGYRGEARRLYAELARARPQLAGRRPRGRPPRARTTSISPSCCRRSTATWPDRPGRAASRRGPGSHPGRHFAPS